MAMVAMAGYHGDITVADAAPQYDNLTGEITRWELTVQSDRYESTPFATAMTSSVVGGYKTVEKGMYTVRGTVSGFWDSAGATTAHAAFAAARPAVSMTFTARGGGATTQQSFQMNCKLNNYQITANKQSGLISFTADVIGEGDIGTIAAYA